MSFMSLSGGTGSSTNFWNFSNKEKEGYSTVLTGYVVEIQSVPKTVFGKNTIDRFDDGNPKRNLRVIIKTDEGKEIAWDFNPGGRDKRANGGEDKRSNAMRALADGIIAAIPTAQDVDAILGCRIQVATQEPPAGWSWSNTNPRPWSVAIDPKNKIEHRGCTIKPDWEKEGGEVDAPPAEPAQVGSPQSTTQMPGPLQEAQQRAAAAVAANTVSNHMQLPKVTINAQNDTPPASVYDDDIPF